MGRKVVTPPSTEPETVARQFFMVVRIGPETGPRVPFLAMATTVEAAKEMVQARFANATVERIDEAEPR